MLSHSFGHDTTLGTAAFCALPLQRLQSFSLFVTQRGTWGLPTLWMCMWTAWREKIRSLTSAKLFKTRCKTCCSCAPQALSIPFLCPGVPRPLRVGRNERCWWWTFSNYFWLYRSAVVSHLPAHLFGAVGDVCCSACTDGSTPPARWMGAYPALPGQLAHTLARLWPCQPVFCKQFLGVGSWLEHLAAQTYFGGC